MLNGTVNGGRLFPAFLPKVGMAGGYYSIDSHLTSAATMLTGQVKTAMNERSLQPRRGKHGLDQSNGEDIGICGEVGTSGRL